MNQFPVFLVWEELHWIKLSPTYGVKPLCFTNSCFPQTIMQHKSFYNKEHLCSTPEREQQSQSIMWKILWPIGTWWVQICCCGILSYHSPHCSFSFNLSSFFPLTCSCDKSLTSWHCLIFAVVCLGLHLKLIDSILGIIDSLLVTDHRKIFQ